MIVTAYLMALAIGCAVTMSIYWEQGKAAKHGICAGIFDHGVKAFAAHLSSLPPSQRQPTLDQHRPYFQYPLGLEPRAAFEPTQAQTMAMCLRNSPYNLQGLVFRLPLASGDQSLVLGPLESPLPKIAPPITFFLITVVIMALFSLGLTRMLAHGIQELVAVAKRLKEGDMSARVNSGKCGGTELSALARQLNAMAARIEHELRQREELLQAVAHEIGTPLAKMRFGLELHAQESDPGLRRKRRAQLEASMEELDDLVSELIDWMRLGQASSLLKKERTDLVARTELMVEEVQFIEARELQWHVDIEGDCIAQVDVHLFERALRNLLLNASRHAASTIWFKMHPLEGGAIELWVEDDGPGVPVAMRERLFEPFVRLDSSRTRQTGGRGLGLAIVERIVQRHGGRVFVEEGRTGGARFVMRWQCE